MRAQIWRNTSGHDSDYYDARLCNTYVVFK